MRANCGHCTKLFDTRNYKLVQQNGVYCSRGCFAEVRRTLPPNKCLTCNKLFDGDRYVKYCSLKCRKVAIEKRTQTKEERADRKYFSRILKQYGLTRTDWQAMYDKFDGKCHICKQPETELHMGRLRRLDIDHCHKTNKVRGLLCAKHNKLLGNARDDIDILRAAISYLESQNETEPSKKSS